MRSISLISGSLVLVATVTVAAPRPKHVPELKTSHGVFHPLEAPSPPPGWYHDSARPSSAQGRRYLMVIGRQGLSTEEISRIEQAGARVLGYMPDHGYLVRVRPL